MDLSDVDLTTEVVRTQRLVLRPYRPEDEDAVFAACQAEDIRRWSKHPVPPDARGHGYAAEAAHAPADWALGLGAPRVHLVADVRTTPSQAVAPRAGFTREGVIRSCLPYRDGTRGDAALFSRLPGD